MAKSRQVDGEERKKGRKGPRLQQQQQQQQLRLLIAKTTTLLAGRLAACFQVIEELKDRVTRNEPLEAI